MQVRTSPTASTGVFGGKPTTEDRNPTTGSRRPITEARRPTTGPRQPTTDHRTATTESPGRRSNKPKPVRVPGALSAGANAATGRPDAALQTGAVVALEQPYPGTPRGDVVDDYHGTKVADPYRWLETSGPARDAWAKQQNDFTRAFLDKLPARGAIEQWMKASYSLGDKGRARQVKDNVFWTERKGGEEQASLYVKAKGGSTRLLVNPVDLDPTATMAISAWTPSPDGKHIAYALNDNGSDWATWRIVEVATGKVLPEELRWTKTSSVEWLPDGSGFYYSALPAPQPGRELQEPVHDQSVKLHTLHSAQSDDVMVYATPEHPDITHDISLSDDDKWLILESSDLRTGATRIAVRPADDPKAEFRTVLSAKDDTVFRIYGGQDSVLNVLTNDNAPRGRVIAVDVAQEHPVIKELLPNDPERTLDNFSVAGDRIYASYLKNGTSELRVFHKGALERTIPLPDKGSVPAFWGTEDGKTAHFTFTNHYTPDIEYAYDTATGKRSVTRPSTIGVDPSQYETHTSFVKSSDGTLVPHLITMRRDTPRDGNTPTFHYAYGGFRANQEPYFSRLFHCWLEMGGILSVPQLRGGNEEGENWHKMGTRQRKQNVFEDYKATARNLVEQRYTTNGRIVLSGASNGGTLVAATITQDPSIAGAALPRVGVNDMLRYHLYTWGPGWIPEYGVSSDPTDFKFLYAYSPYHNVRDGVHYLATMWETGDSDDRVEPSHTYKTGAAMQAAQAGKEPVLIRVDHDTGHGAGKPIGKMISQAADELAFALNAIGANTNAEKLFSKRGYANGLLHPKQQDPFTGPGDTEVAA